MVCCRSSINFGGRDFVFYLRTTLAEEEDGEGGFAPVTLRKKYFKEGVVQITTVDYVVSFDLTILVIIS